MHSEHYVGPDGQPVSQEFLQTMAPAVTRRQLVTEMMERRRAEEERDRFFSLSIDLLCIAGLDGVFQRVNPAFERILGYPAEALLDHSCFEFIHPEDQERTRQAMAQLAQGIDLLQFENRYRCQDGTWRWLAWNCPAPPAGSALIYAVARDVTDQKATEQRLRASEERLRSLMELSSDWYWEQDEHFRFVGLSDLVEHGSGFGVNEHLGKTRWELPTLGMTDADWAAHQAVLAAHQPFYDLEFRRPDVHGTPVYVSISGRPIFDPQGRFAGYCGIGKNVTARRLAELEVQRQRKELQQIFDAVQAQVWYVDTQARVVRHNRFAEMATGLGMEQVVGKTFLELDLLQEYAQSLHQDITAVLRSAAPRLGTVTSYSRQGESRWASIDKVPTFDADGKLLGVIVFIYDITALKQAEESIRRLNEELEDRVRARTTQLVVTYEALRDSEERFRSTFAQAAVGMAHVALDGRFIVVNQKLCDILGFTREELLVRTFHEITHPEDLQPDLGYLHRLLADEITSFTLEKRYLRPNGRYIWANLTVALVRDAMGFPKYFISVVEDITQRKQAEEVIRTLNAELEERVRERTAQLSAVNKELEAFSYSVSHDLRAPLRAIDGFSQALLEDYPECLDHTGTHYLHRIRAASQRMGLLIDDLLQLSRVTRHVLSRMPVQLSTLVDQILAELRASHPTRQVTCTVTPGVVAVADPNLIRIVLFNLLENAWKYTSKHAQARIEFGLLPATDLPVYFVRDDGAGFDMAYADKLFGAFQRLHRAKEFEGTGIGLATVERIVHRHGGRIWAEGEVERGATFYFTL